ncbi:MAG: M16 family metallopeptidase [Anaerolineae bacterium]
MSGASGTTRHVLDNGLTVLVRPTHHAPVATFWMWYGVGSRNETPGRTGISHWVEHMLFKGSERYPAGEMDRLVAREGGVFNGLTWVDFTTYFETLPADRIDLALDIEADRMTSALFRPEDVDSERTVVISEREGNENSPMFLLSEEVQTIAIKAHPYHHEVLGWMSDLETMTRDDLWEHYRRYYHPANATAVAVGAFDADDMLRRIEDRYGAFEPGAAPGPVGPTEPPQRGERRTVVRGPDPTSYVIVAYRAPAASDDDYFALEVLNTVLGGAHSMNLFGGSPPNRSSRLYRALVDKELATAVSTSMAATIDPYLYSVSAVVRDGGSAAAVEAAILDEMDRVRSERLSEDALATAKKQARAQFAYSAESVTDQGFWLGYAEVVSNLKWFEEYLDRLDAVTADDVLRSAQLRLGDDQRTTGHYVPTGGDSPGGPPPGARGDGPAAARGGAS